MIKTRLYLLIALYIFSSTQLVSAEDTTQVKIQTNLGDITLELYPDKAPKTVANFLGYINDGFYDNTIFHRVIKGFMAQGGGYDDTYKRKSTSPPIPNEANNGLKNLRGTIAMARLPQPHSATAQFFINLVDNSFLDFKSESNQGWGYCVFGKVIDGMQTVDEIGSTITGPAGPFAKDVPQAQIVIKTITLLEPQN